MTHMDARIADDIEVYLDAQAHKSFLRFITCGSVDDGKSTLIGRLLYDCQLIYEDQLAAIARDSRTVGTQGEQLDLALLVDGLAAEREQGITIDVAYRFFSTRRRKFIVADTPGHEQYTRNMATGASTADVAVLLVDARHGLQVQTRRHAYIAALLGIRHVVVGVNKMDIMNYDQSVFNTIDVAFRQFAAGFGFCDICCIPISALNGDNVTRNSTHMPWYQGATLLSFLEDVEVEREDLEAPFRMPVQWVNRPDSDFRGYCGTIISGTVALGDEIISLPSGQRSRVKSVLTTHGERTKARAAMAVTLTLQDAIDTSRGDMICAADAPCLQADQFQAHILWMHEQALYPGRQYWLKTANKTVSASITNIKHRIDINDSSAQAAKILNLNEVGVASLSLSVPVIFDAYEDNRHSGSFILIDKQSHATVAAGMVDFALRRAANVTWQSMDISKALRADQKHQKPALLWFTGLSGSGKSTIANLVEKKLFEYGRHTYTLDGDNVRHGLNRDLGFTQADRVENIRRISEVAKLMLDAGLMTLTAFISPFRAERQMARDLVDTDEFIEIFIDTPLDICEQRDVKGLYAKARRGEIKNFTGIDSIYQPPESPEIIIDTQSMSAQKAADKIVQYLQTHGFLTGYSE